MVSNNSTGLPVVLYRILGNDLPPRHNQGQTCDNLKFILDNEPVFPDCHKRWIVNRIVDLEAEERIITLLKKYSQPYMHIPFVGKKYQAYRRQSPKKYSVLFKIILSIILSRKQVYARLMSLKDTLMHINYDLAKYNKILYVMNNNGARNAALREGKRLANWVLPFDGNCSFTSEGWQQVLDKLSPSMIFNRLFMVPMYRLSKNEEYFNFRQDGLIEHEPQVIFGKNSNLEFNENYCYGYLSKLELFQRMGLRLRESSQAITVDEPQYRCGYVLRLASGNSEGDNLRDNRFNLRNEAIDRLFQKLDR